MGTQTNQSAQGRRSAVFEAVVRAARKAGASEALAVCFAKYLLEDKKIRIVVRREGKEQDADE